MKKIMIKDYEGELLYANYTDIIKKEDAIFRNVNDEYHPVEEAKIKDIDFELKESDKNYANDIAYLLYKEIRFVLGKNDRLYYPLDKALKIVEMIKDLKKDILLSNKFYKIDHNTSIVRNKENDLIDFLKQKHIDKDEAIEILKKKGCL